MSTTQGLSVVSSARKLVIQVPESNRVVEFPEGVHISSYGKGNDAPVIVVHNATDKGKELSPGVFEHPEGTWQGAKSGQFIILNEVSEEAAVAAICHAGNNYTMHCVEVALEELVQKGFRDQYTTNLEFVQENLSPAGFCVGLEQCCTTGKILALRAGIVKRDARDIMTAVRKDGAVFVDHGKGEPKRVEEDIFLRTYRNVDGSEIELDDVPEEELVTA